MTAMSMHNCFFLRTIKSAVGLCLNRYDLRVKTIDFHSCYINKEKHQVTSVDLRTNLTSHFG
jgi:hypothetical protein